MNTTVVPDDEALLERILGQAAHVIEHQIATKLRGRQAADQAEATNDVRLYIWRELKEQPHRTRYLKALNDPDRLQALAGQAASLAIRRYCHRCYTREQPAIFDATDERDPIRLHAEADTFARQHANNDVPWNALQVMIDVLGGLDEADRVVYLAATCQGLKARDIARTYPHLVATPGAARVRSSRVHKLLVSVFAHALKQERGEGLEAAERESLERWLAGTLSWTETGALSAHLAQCQLCSDVLGQLIAARRELHPLLFPGPILALAGGDLLSHAHHSTHTAASTTAATTGAGGSGTAAIAAKGLLAASVAGSAYLALGTGAPHAHPLLRSSAAATAVSAPTSTTAATVATKPFSTTHAPTRRPRVIPHRRPATHPTQRTTHPVSTPLYRPTPYAAQPTRTRTLPPTTRPTTTSSSSTSPSGSGSPSGSASPGGGLGFGH